MGKVKLDNLYRQQWLNESENWLRKNGYVVNPEENEKLTCPRCGVTKIYKKSEIEKSQKRSICHGKRKRDSMYLLCVCRRRLRKWKKKCISQGTVSNLFKISSEKDRKPQNRNRSEQTR